MESLLYIWQQLKAVSIVSDGSHRMISRMCLLSVVLCCHSHCYRSVNKRADNGTTPVYFAAQEGRLECLKFLIAQARKPKQKHRM